MKTIRIQFLNNAKKRVKKKVTRKPKPPTEGKEKTCVDNFRYLGESEVKTPFGYIDLLTKDYVVEFKIYTSAKAALGQILCYSHSINPKRKRLIVLFGKGLSSWKGFKLFEKICALYDVEVFKLSSNSKYKILKQKLK